MAHQEILRQQEKRLREQLAAEKAAAFEQIEEERIANEKRYREKMATLEMDRFRHKCSQEILDTEKRALLAEQQMKSEPPFEYRPYQSNLLDEIKRIIHHPSEDCLHQTQLKVFKQISAIIFAMIISISLLRPGQRSHSTLS